jgi:predicted dehydrogenase
MDAGKSVCIGLVGAGYAAYLHGNGYEKVSGVPVRLKTVVDVDAGKAEAVKRRYAFEKSGSDYREILDDPEIGVVDIVTPPFLHAGMIREALDAGKHVICEKPLTGYHGEPGDGRPIGRKVPKKKMYEAVMRDLDELGKLVESAEKSGKRFFYAENYVYATPIVKAAEVISRKKSKILFMKGEESVKGSTSPVAGEWEKTGGGSLIRLGTHPLSGMLYLKQAEARARGEDISVRSVTADAGFVTECLTEREHRHITARPQDVEDFSNVTVTFSDGTKAVVIATDLVLGGTKNYVEVYANDSALLCNLTPTDMLNAYFLDEDGLEDVAISEMLPQKLGWNKAFVSDEIVRGYIGEFQDFMESVALDRSAASGFSLARDTARVIYAAYRSAEEGVKINL